MPIVGTSGHVDHGKTLLIEALTGINADRLPEERARGMTIDLGFAHFLAPDGGPIGVVDVPGHERFIRNMVAGAWGLDLGLLCVAADDGWMPQSADHARVLRLLGVPRVILVITKTDIASEERAEEVRAAAARELARIGYPGAACQAVSAVSGRGVQALRTLIVEQLATGRSAGEPPRAERGAAEGAGAAFLYVDRVFSVRGSGLVVTGSLRGGPLTVGEQLGLWPAGRSARVRGLQSYHAELRRVPPGSRVALNLQGLGQADIRRGDCLAAPGAPVTAARELLARLRAAPGAAVPGRVAPDPGEAIRVKGNQEVEVSMGTGHWKARLSLLSARPQGAGPTLARLLLESPAALCWAQPLVLIPQGGTAILGGGQVLWSGPTAKEQRRRLLAAAADLPSHLLPVHLQVLQLAVQGAIRAPAGGGTPPGAERLGDWLVRGEKLRELEGLLQSRAAAPGGVRLEELASSGAGAAAPQELLQAAADALLRRGLLSRREGVLLPARRPAARPTLDSPGSASRPGAGRGAETAPAPSVSPMGRELLGRLRSAGAAGLDLPRLKIAGAKKELRALARAGLAVSLDGSIYYAVETYRELARAVLAGSAPGELIGVAEAKSRAGLTRKYIIPLLNRMETDGLLRREGDLRRVLPPPS